MARLPGGRGKDPDRSQGVRGARDRAVVDRPPSAQDRRKSPRGAMRRPPILPARRKGYTSSRSRGRRVRFVSACLAFTDLIMPTYDYRCKKCSHTWEEFQSIKAPASKKCRSARNCKPSGRSALEPGSSSGARGSISPTTAATRTRRRAPPTADRAVPNPTAGANQNIERLQGVVEARPQGKD